MKSLHILLMVFCFGVSLIACGDEDDATDTGDTTGDVIRVGVQKCAQTQECPEGQICQGGECRIAQCSLDEDCQSAASVCRDGLCVDSTDTTGDDDDDMHPISPACELGKEWQICWDVLGVPETPRGCYFVGHSAISLGEDGCTKHPVDCADVLFVEGIYLNCSAGEGQWPFQRWAGEFAQGQGGAWTPVLNGRLRVLIDNTELPGNMEVVNTGTQEAPVGNLRFTPTLSDPL